jgi:hypothetical protein
MAQYFYSTVFETKAQEFQLHRPLPLHEKALRIIWVYNKTPSRRRRGQKSQRTPEICKSVRTPHPPAAIAAVISQPNIVRITRRPSANEKHHQRHEETSDDPTFHVPMLPANRIKLRFLFGMKIHVPFFRVTSIAAQSMMFRKEPPMKLVLLALILIFLPNCTNPAAEAL